ncbi:hypothetical protein, partial [Virgibacillus alimentarius]|uniref:hypothetical protein n=1 Tax=Virgibacillus alimentarius TaxID=698769 RepID=UPI00056EAC14
SVDLHPQPQAIIYILDILVVLFSFQRANCSPPFKMATLLIYHSIIFMSIGISKNLFQINLSAHYLLK